MRPGADAFINCPFDSAYRPRFFALTFALLNSGFRPRAALEVDDSATSRLDRLIAIIEACPLSIHDLCRIDEPRFNMPFEAGLAVAFDRKAGGRRRSLILATSRKKFDRACSDLRGVDPRIYRGATGAVVEVTRWLQQYFRGTPPNAKAAARRFSRFWRALPAAAAKNDLGYLDLTWHEMLFVIHTWLERNPP